jgi:hypothetical protein
MANLFNSKKLLREHGKSSKSMSNLIPAPSQINPYKSYQAVITQSGTSAPSAVVGLNELGATMTWTRTSAGLYTLTAGSAVLTSGKTVIFLSAPITGLVSYLVVPTSTSVITVSTLLLSVVATVLTAVNTDALMTNLGIEIRVYN